MANKLELVSLGSIPHCYNHNVNLLFFSKFCKIVSKIFFFFNFSKPNFFNFQVKSLKFATEAAITILRIDDLIKLEPEKGEESAYQQALQSGQLDG